jgi:hypothetical protein
MGSRSSRKYRTTLKIAGVIGICLLSGGLGGALTRNFGTSSHTLSYADFISIMLTAISLLMTVLAIFLGVLGFLGWTTIEQKVHDKTEEILGNGFKEGGALKEKVEQAIERNTEAIMFRGVQPVGEANLDTDEDYKEGNGGEA